MLSCYWLSKNICYIFFISLLIIFSCNNTDQVREKPLDDSTSSEESHKNSANLHAIKIDGILLRVEIVQDAESRAEGLMHRERLPENQGMLFVFDSTHMLSFWMRNTFIPLDIAFINESGRIVDIQRMAPLDESKQYISAEPALYALEVNAGWFEKHGIDVGSQVQF